MIEYIHVNYPIAKELDFLHSLEKIAYTGRVFTKNSSSYKIRRNSYGWIRANNLMRRPKPTLSKATTEQPETYRILCEIASKIEEDYPNEFPYRDIEHRMGDTSFTGCVVNYSCAMTEHVDSINIPGSKSAMIVLKTPTTVGGALELTETGEKIHLKNHDLLIFEGSKHPHRVTPIKGKRVSIVFFSNKNL